MKQNSAMIRALDRFEESLLQYCKEHEFQPHVDALGLCFIQPIEKKLIEEKVKKIGDDFSKKDLENGSAN